MKKLSVILSKEKAGTFKRGSPVIILTEGQAPAQGGGEEGQGRQSHTRVEGARTVPSVHQPEPSSSTSIHFVVSKCPIFTACAQHKSKLHCQHTRDWPGSPHKHANSAPNGRGHEDR